MPKARKSKAIDPIKQKMPCGLVSWREQHQSNHSEIEAYVEASRQWEIIAEVKCFNHMIRAEFIVRTLNSHAEQKNLIGALIDTLELCLACDGKLTWEAEQEASVLCRKIKQETA